MTNAPILASYNPNDKLTLQADSSKDDIAAVLLQQGKNLPLVLSLLLSVTGRKQRKKL